MLAVDIFSKGDIPGIPPIANAILNDNLSPFSASTVKYCSSCSFKSQDSTLISPGSKYTVSMFLFSTFRLINLRILSMMSNCNLFFELHFSISSEAGASASLLQIIPFLLSHFFFLLLIILRHTSTVSILVIIVEWTHIYRTSRSDTKR